MYSSSLELYFFVCIALLTANQFVYLEAPSYGIPCSEFVGPQYRCVSRSSCPLKYNDQILPLPSCGPEGIGVCCPIISKRSPPRCGIRQYHKVQKNPFQNPGSRGNPKITTDLNHTEKIRIKHYRTFAEDKHLRNKSVIETTRSDSGTNLEVHSDELSKSFQLQNKALHEASVNARNPKNSLRKDQTMNQYQANRQNMNQVMKPHYIKQTNAFIPINNRNSYQKRPVDESWRILNRNFGNFLLPNKVSQETIPQTLISSAVMYQKLGPARNKFADLEIPRERELTMNAWNRNQIRHKMHSPNLDLKLWKNNYSNYINHLRYPNINYQWDPFNNVKYFKAYENLENFYRLNERISSYPRLSDTLNYFLPNIVSLKEIPQTLNSAEAMHQKPLVARNAYKSADLEIPSQSELAMNAWNRNQLKHMMHIPNLHLKLWNESYSSYINHLRYPYINYKFDPFNNMKYFKERKDLERFYKMNQRFPPLHYENLKNLHVMNGRFSNYPRLGHKLHDPQQWRQNIFEREPNYAMHQYETQKAKFVDDALYQYKNDKNWHLPYILPSSNDLVQESQYMKDLMKSLGFEDKRPIFQPSIEKPFRNYRSNNFLGKLRIKRHVISSHVSPREIGYQTSNQSISHELEFPNKNFGISNQTQITKELNISLREDISDILADKNNANRRKLKSDMLIKSTDTHVKKDMNSSFLPKRQKRIDDNLQYAVYRIKAISQKHEANKVKRLPEKSPEKTHYSVSSEKNYNWPNKTLKTKDQNIFHHDSAYIKKYHQGYIRKINNGTLFGTDSATPNKSWTTVDQAFENKNAKITKSNANQFNELKNGSSDGEKAGIEKDIKFLNPKMLPFNKEMFPEMVHADFKPKPSYQKQLISHQEEEDFDLENPLKEEILLEPLHQIWSPNKRKRSSNKSVSSNGSNAEEISPQKMAFMNEHVYNSNNSTKINSSDEKEYSRIHHSVESTDKIIEGRLEYNNITETMHYLNSVTSESNIINNSVLYIDAIEGQNTEHLSGLSIFTNNDNNLKNTESTNISDLKEVDAINSYHMKSGSLDNIDGGQENRELLFDGYKKSTRYSSVSELNEKAEYSKGQPRINIFYNFPKNNSSNEQKLEEIRYNSNEYNINSKFVKKAELNKHHLSEQSFSHSLLHRAALSSDKNAENTENPPNILSANNFKAFNSYGNVNPDVKTVIYSSTSIKDILLENLSSDAIHEGETMLFRKKKHNTEEAFTSVDTENSSVQISELLPEANNVTEKQYTGNTLNMAKENNVSGIMDINTDSNGKHFSVQIKQEAYSNLSIHTYAPFPDQKEQSIWESINSITNTFNSLNINSKDRHESEGSDSNKIFQGTKTISVSEGGERKQENEEFDKLVYMGTVNESNFQFPTNIKPSEEFISDESNFRMLENDEIKSLLLTSEALINTDSVQKENDDINRKQQSAVGLVEESEHKAMPDDAVDAKSQSLTTGSEIHIPEQSENNPVEASSAESDEYSDINKELLKKFEQEFEKLLPKIYETRADNLEISSENIFLTAQSSEDNGIHNINGLDEEYKDSTDSDERVTNMLIALDTNLRGNGESEKNDYTAKVMKSGYYVREEPNFTSFDDEMSSRLSEVISSHSLNLDKIWKDNDDIDKKSYIMISAEPEKDVLPKYASKSKSPSLKPMIAGSENSPESMIQILNNTDVYNTGVDNAYNVYSSDDKRTAEINDTYKTKKEKNIDIDDAREILMNNGNSLANISATNTYSRWKTSAAQSEMFMFRQEEQEKETLLEGNENDSTNSEGTPVYSVTGSQLHEQTEINKSKTSSNTSDKKTQYLKQLMRNYQKKLAELLFKSHDTVTHVSNLKSLNENASATARKSQDNDMYHTDGEKEHDTRTNSDKDTAEVITPLHENLSDTDIKERVRYITNDINFSTFTKDESVSWISETPSSDSVDVAKIQKTSDVIKNITIMNDIIAKSKNNSILKYGADTEMLSSVEFHISSNDNSQNTGGVEVNNIFDISDGENNKGNTRSTDVYKPAEGKILEISKVYETSVNYEDNTPLKSVEDVYYKTKDPTKYIGPEIAPVFNQKEKQEEERSVHGNGTTTSSKTINGTSESFFSENEFPDHSKINTIKEYGSNSDQKNYRFNELIKSYRKKTEELWSRSYANITHTEILKESNENSLSSSPESQSSDIYPVREDKQENRSGRSTDEESQTDEMLIPLNSTLDERENDASNIKIKPNQQNSSNETNFSSFTADQISSQLFLIASSYSVTHETVENETSDIDQKFRITTITEEGTEKEFLNRNENKSIPYFSSSYFPMHSENTTVHIERSLHGNITSTNSNGISESFSGNEFLDHSKFNTAKESNSKSDQKNYRFDELIKTYRKKTEELWSSGYENMTHKEMLKQSNDISISRSENSDSSHIYVVREDTQKEGGGKNTHEESETKEMLTPLNSILDEREKDNSNVKIKTNEQTSSEVTNFSMFTAEQISSQLLVIAPSYSITPETIQKETGDIDHKFHIMTTSTVETEQEFLTRNDLGSTKYKNPSITYFSSTYFPKHSENTTVNEERSLHGFLTSKTNNGTSESFFNDNEFPYHSKINTVKESNSNSDQKSYRFNELIKTYRKKTKDLWHKGYENMTYMEIHKESNENNISSSPESESSDIYPLRENTQEDRSSRSTDRESKRKEMLVPLNSTLDERGNDASSIKTKSNERNSTDETNYNMFTGDKINSQLLVIAPSYSITPRTVQNGTGDIDQKFHIMSIPGEGTEQEFFNRSETGSTKYETPSVPYFSNSYFLINSESTTVNVERSFHRNVTSTSSNGNSESFFSGNEFPDHSKINTIKESGSNSDQKSYSFNELIETYRNKTKELWSKGYKNMTYIEIPKESNENNISSSPESYISDIYLVREDTQKEKDGRNTDGESETKQMLIPMNSTSNERENDASNMKIKLNEQISSDETNFSMFTGSQILSSQFVIASLYSITPETVQKGTGDTDQKFPVMTITGERTEHEFLNRKETGNIKYEYPSVPYFGSTYFPIHSENTTINIERSLHGNATSTFSNGNAELFFSGNEFPDHSKINTIKESGSNSDQKSYRFNELIKTYRMKTEDLWSEGYENMTYMEIHKKSNENNISSSPESESRNIYAVREDTLEDRSSDEDSETNEMLIPLNSTLDERENDASNIKIKPNDPNSKDKMSFSMFTDDQITSQLFVVASSYPITPETAETVQKETADIDQKFHIMTTTEERTEQEFLNINETGSATYEHLSVPYFGSSYFPLHSESTTVNVERSFHRNVTSTSSNGNSGSFFSGNEFPDHSKLNTIKQSGSNSDQKSYSFNELIKTYRKKTKEMWSKGYENMTYMEILKESNENNISSSPESESSDIYPVHEDTQQDRSGRSTDEESQTDEMLILLNSTLYERENDSSNIKIKPTEQNSSDETNFNMFTGDQISSQLSVIASSYSITPEIVQKETRDIRQNFHIMTITEEGTEQEFLSRNETGSTKYETLAVPYFGSSYFPIYSESTTANVERSFHGNVTSTSSNRNSDSFFSGNEFPDNSKINTIKESGSNSDQKSYRFNELIKTYRKKTEELWSKGYGNITYMEIPKESNENNISSLPESYISDIYLVREDTQKDRDGRSTDGESETKETLMPLNRTLDERENDASNMKIKPNEQNSRDERNFSMFISSQLFVTASSYSITPETVQKETGDIDHKFPVMTITGEGTEQEFLNGNETGNIKYEYPSVSYFRSSYFPIYWENTTVNASSGKSSQNNEHLKQLVKNYVINGKILLNRNYENINQNLSHIVQGMSKEELLKEIQNEVPNTSEQNDYEYERSPPFLKNTENKDMVKKFHIAEEISAKIADNNPYTLDQTLKYIDVDFKHQSWTAAEENSSHHSQSVNSEIVSEESEKANGEYSLNRKDYKIINKTQKKDSVDVGLESTLLRVREGHNRITLLGTKVFQESFKTNDGFEVKTPRNSREKNSSMQIGNKIIETTEKNSDTFSQEHENIFVHNQSMHINNTFSSILPMNKEMPYFDSVTKSNISPRMYKTILMKAANEIPLLLPKNTRNDTDKQLATIWQVGRGNINKLFDNSGLTDSYSSEKSVETQGEEESSISTSYYINLNEERNGITLITENTTDQLNIFNVSLEIDRNITGYETRQLLFRRNTNNEKNSSTVEDNITETFSNVFEYGSGNEEPQDIITRVKDKQSMEISLGSNTNQDPEELILGFHSLPLSAVTYNTKLAINSETENFTLQVEINKTGIAEKVDKATKVQSLVKTAGLPNESSTIADLIQDRVSDQNMTLTAIANVLHTFENLSNAQEPKNSTHESTSDIPDFKVDIDSRVPNTIAKTQTDHSRNSIVFKDDNNREESYENRLFMRKTRNDIDEDREIMLISKLGISPTQMRNESTKTTVRTVKFDVAGKSVVLIKDGYTSTQDTRKQSRIRKITDLHASEKSTERQDLEDSPLSSSADYNDLKEENDINLIVENTTHPSDIFNVSLKFDDNTAGSENHELMLRQDVNNANNASIAITHFLTKAFSNLFGYESGNEDPQDMSRRKEGKTSTEIFSGSDTLEMKESTYSFVETSSPENFHNISEVNDKLPGFTELEIDNDIMNTTFRANSDSNLTFIGNNQFFEQDIENTIVHDPNMQVNTTSSAMLASYEETYFSDLTGDLHILFRKESTKDAHIVTQDTIPLMVTNKSTMNSDVLKIEKVNFSDNGAIVALITNNETSNQGFAFSDNDHITTDSPSNELSDQGASLMVFDRGSMVPKIHNDEKSDKDATTFISSDGVNIALDETNDKAMNEGMTFAFSDDGSITSERTRNKTLDQDTTFAFSDDGSISSEKTQNESLDQGMTFTFSDVGRIASEEITKEISDQNAVSVLSDDSSITTEETRNRISERAVTFTFLVSGSINSEEKHIGTSDQLATFPMWDGSNTASEESSNKALDQGTISALPGGGNIVSDETSHEISDQDTTFAFSNSSNIAAEITNSETLVKDTTVISSVISNEISDESTTFVFWNGSNTVSEVVNNGISNQSIITAGTLLNMQASEDLVDGGKTEIYAENSGFDVKSNLHFETSVDSFVSASSVTPYRNVISKHSENNVANTSSLLFPLNNITYEGIAMSNPINDISLHLQTPSLENTNITISDVKRISPGTEFFSSRAQEYKDTGEIFSYETVSSGNLQQQAFVSNDSGVNVPVTENKTNLSMSSYSSVISINHPITESVNINQTLTNESDSTEIPKTSFLISGNPITVNILSLTQQQNFEELDPHSNDNPGTFRINESLRAFDNDTFSKYETYGIHSSAYNATNDYSALETEMTLEETDVQQLSSYEVNDTFSSDSVKTKSTNASNSITLRIIYSSILNEKTANQPDNELTKPQHFSFDHDLLKNDHFLKTWDRNYEDKEFEEADSGDTFAKDDDEEESEEGFRYWKGPEYIIGGRYEEEPWSWMVSIYTYPKMEFVCAGSLIDDVHILSAAHCFDITKKEKYITFIGYLQRPVEYSSYQNVQNIGHKVKKLYLHENFTTECFCNDIAILKLEEPVGPEYTPICLPELDAAVGGENTTVLGWGDTFYDPESDVQGTEILQRVDDLTIYSKNDCYKIMSNIVGSKISKDFGEYYICAGVPNGEKDACTGDSGGPLMHEDYDGVWSLVGIVSFGVKCGEPGVPGFYSRVSYYMPWILSVIGSNA